MAAETINPGYRALYESGELIRRAAAARERLVDCRCCPRQCQVNRLDDEKGVCRTGKGAMVSSWGAHFGEESPLVGTRGSGTIFFTNCSLLCVFCQNYEISHLGDGSEVSDQDLATLMVSLQGQGCHNINLVTPSHVVPQILSALPHAVELGLSVPLVYNSSGYEMVSTLKFLDGIVDIYMPDFKFWFAESSTRYAKAPDYPDRARAALKEMHRQVGDLEIDKKGIAVRGLLVRHLVMPDGLGETLEIMRFLSDEISADTYVNIMDQYRPCGQASRVPPLDRGLAHEEYIEALQLAQEAGLKRLDQKDWARLIKKLGDF